MFAGYPNTQNIYTTIWRGNGSGAIIDVAIHGPDKTKPHKVWLYARGRAGRRTGASLCINDGTMASPDVDKDY